MPPRSGDLSYCATLRGVACVEPCNQMGVAHLTFQTFVDFYSCSFEKSHKSIESRAQVSCLQGLQRSRKKSSSFGVDHRIGPRRQTCGLAALAEVCSALMFLTYEPFRVCDCFFRVLAFLANGNARPTQHGSRTALPAGCGGIGELQLHSPAGAGIIRISKAVGAVDRIRSRSHEIVDLDRIPLHRVGVGCRNQGVEAI